MSNKSDLFEDEIKFDLEVNKDMMDIILQNYKKTYVPYKTYNTPEYATMFNNVKQNVQKEFANLSQLENMLLRKITEQQKYIAESDKLISTLKEGKYMLTEEKRSASVLKNTSMPRYANSRKAKAVTIYFMIFQLVAILGLSMLFYSSYKQTNARENITKATTKATQQIKEQARKLQQNIQPSSTSQKSQNIKINQQLNNRSKIGSSLFPPPVIPSNK